MTSRLHTEGLSAGWCNPPVAKVEHLFVNQAEITVLAGPNGAGKSTLLKSFARLLRPLDGAVCIDGRDIWKMSTGEFARQVAYVPQLLEISRRLTVEEWVALGRNPHQSFWSWSMTSRDREIVGSVLERTGVADLKGRYIDGLSGGERQRVFIATALAQEPGFLLLDEPTAHLDFRHQLELCELLDELSDSGIGVLIVLHDLNLISRLADRVIFLKRTADGAGHILKSGAKEEVLEPSTLRRVYDVDVTVLLDAESGLTSFLPARVAG